MKNKNSFLLGLALLGLATIVKAQTAGTFNTTFGTNGLVTTDISYASNNAKKELIQSDGKIIIIGYNENAGGIITRYNANGTLDTTFNGTGRQFNDVYFANAALQSDGKIVLIAYNKVYRYNSNGTLDTTFGANGVYTYSVPSGTSFSINDIAVQSDGKIVLSAYEDLYLNNVSNLNFAALRLNSNGTIDTTFNGTGKVSKDINKTDNAGAVAIQTDGKIILAGYTTNATGNQFYTAVRFNSNGSIDTTFGNAGVVTGNNTLAGYLSGGIALQSDGKIILTGNSTFTGIKTVRLNTNGTLDNTFNGTGAVTTNLADDTTKSVAIQSDGKIVVSGSKYDATAHTSEYFVLRYNTNGTLDTTFNSTGVVLASIDKTKPNTAADVKIQTDGKIVVCGSSYVGSYKDIAVIRLNTNGTLDNTFNGTGKLTSGFLKSGSDRIEKLAVQSDGKILAAGYTSTNNISLARYNANGTLDTSFNTKGYVTSNFQHTYFGNFFNSLAVLSQTDGKILIVGDYYSSTSNKQEIFVRRYNQIGTVDTTFGTSGMASLGINAKGTFSNAAILQTDGKIMIVGSSYVGTDNVFTLVRFNTNGTLDTTFNGTGFLNTTINVNSVGNSILLQPDGKILVGGWITNGTDRDLLLMRYNTNGTLDSTFNGNGKVTQGVGTGNDEILKLVLQSDGKIAVLSSYANAFGNSRLALLRYNSNGSLDTSFNSTGQLLTDYSSFSGRYNDMVLDPLNRIIISSAYGAGIVRYNTNGTLDTTFVKNEIFLDQFNPRSLIITNNHLVTGGDYFSNNNNSLDFALSSINLYNVGIVGTFTSWGSTPDVAMSSADGINYSVNNHTFPATEVKFRQNNDWEMNWGGNAFPTGTGIISGPNITVPAGIYTVKFNIVSADYSFTKNLGTADSGKRAAFSFSPNPAKEKIIFNEDVRTVEIFALDGKRLNVSFTNKEANVSTLSKGIYIIKATSSHGDIMGGKLIKE